MGNTLGARDRSPTVGNVRIFSYVRVLCITALMASGMATGLAGCVSTGGRQYLCENTKVRASFSELRANLQEVGADVQERLVCDSDDPEPAAFGQIRPPVPKAVSGCRSSDPEEFECERRGVVWYVRLERSGDVQIQYRQLQGIESAQDTSR